MPPEPSSLRTRPAPQPERRRRARYVAASAFAASIAIGLIATLANPALVLAPEASFWDGEAASAYQRALDESSPLLGASRTVWGLVDFLAFGQGRAGVLVGSDGWLYSAEEYDVVGDPAAAVATWSDAIIAVRDRLAGDGIELVVALVPAKAAMVPGPSPAPLPEGARRRYDIALQALISAQVVAPDLRPVLAAAGRSGDVFLRTDTHWTPHGAEAAAVAIASTIDEATGLSGLGSTPFATEIVATEPLLGDLTSFLDLGPLAARFGPAPDPLEIRRTVSLEGPGDDLFAEVRLSVALVGTSYSADARWNVAGALRDALGLDLHEAAITGFGPWEPMQRYLASEAFASTPPEVIVWEIPERYLTLDGYVPGSAAP